MKWSSRAWASAEPSVGSVPAPSSSSRTSVSGPAASTIVVIRRRWPENVDSDWATDCSSPMSANTSRQTGSRLPGSGRDVEAGLVHQAEQPERAQRDGLAAGVRAGHDEGRVAVADADVDRHDATGQARVARRQQHDLGPIRRLGAGRVHLGGERRLGRPQVEARAHRASPAGPRR